MFSTLSINFWLTVFIALTVFQSCNNSEESSHYGQVKESSIYPINDTISKTEWTSALSELGYQGNLENFILFVSSSSHCSSCLYELYDWNRKAINGEISENMLLIVIEKYQARYENFITNNNIGISSVQDSSAILIAKKFIPQVPVKIYFNESGQIARIHSLGGDSFLEEFRAELSSSTITY